jgi:hypothetical protein
VGSSQFKALRGSKRRCLHSCYTPQVKFVCRRRVGSDRIRGSLGSVSYFAFGVVWMKVYCENGALTPRIRGLELSGHIELIHFPYDPNSHSRHYSGVANPSGAQIRDLNLPISDLPGAVVDYAGSCHFAEIVSIVGSSNRCDSLHIDSAFKSGCSAFVTADLGILNHKARLENLLGIRFFHPNEFSELEQFASSYRLE